MGARGVERYKDIHRAMVWLRSILKMIYKEKAVNSKFKSEVVKLLAAITL